MVYLSCAGSPRLSGKKADKQCSSSSSSSDDHQLYNKSVNFDVALLMTLVMSDKKSKNDKVPNFE